MGMANRGHSLDINDKAVLRGCLDTLQDSISVRLVFVSMSGLLSVSVSPFKNQCPSGLLLACPRDWRLLPGRWD